MIGRVIEVAGEDQHLDRSRGFMTVVKDGEEEGRIPLDDIGVLLCNARGLTYSHSLLTALAERGTAVVLCGPKFLPVAWLWPLEGHHVQALRMRQQLEASQPLCKRLWQAIVRAKIAQQQHALTLFQAPAEGFAGLARRVRSGDPENVEAQAARRYWPLLFGSEFRRHRFGPMPNPFLNYGYTVLRAAVARAIVAAGLHPSLGIHHHNRANAMCLVDDLMEPFRPLVDCVVVRLARAGYAEVTPETKRALAAVLTLDMETERGTTPLQTCLERAAQSLARAYKTGEPALVLPGQPLSVPAPPAAEEAEGCSAGTG